MALLGPRTRTLAAAAAAVLSPACESGDVRTHVTATVFDSVVSCADGTGCSDRATGAPATGERFDFAGVLSEAVSRHEPGLYVYAGGFRANGAFAELELDFPADTGGGIRAVDASYREYAGGSAVFAAQLVRGSITVASGNGGGPFVGYFDLQFADPGPDGVAGDADDLVRSLRFGAFALPGYEPDEPQRPVEPIGPGVHVEVGVDVYVPDPDSGYDPSGCEGGSTDPSASSGCEGSSDSGSSGGSGCEGDTMGDSAGGEGCEGDGMGDAGGGEGCAGDTGGGGGGCAGDTGGANGCSVDASTTARPRGRANRAAGASLPWLGLLLTTLVLRRTTSRDPRRPGTGGASDSR